MSIYVWAKQWISGKNAAIAAIAISTIVPTILVAQNWDDHDRSGRYTARDLAINYLESCEPNAILFTYGDNDTFPLWYVQDVEGVRTDVRVVNLSLLSADWYIDQMKRKAYESEPVPFSLTLDKFIQGKRDLVPLIASTMYMLNEKYVANRYNFEGFYKKLYEEFIGGIKSSKFSEEYKSDYEVLLKGYQNISPVKFISLVNNLSQKENIEKLNINNDFITNLKTGSDSLLNLISESPLLMSDAMDFLASDSPERKVGVGTPDEMNFIPSKKFIIPVDKKKVLSNKSIPKNKESQLLSHLEWNIPRSYITKSDMMIFDLIATNNWERPVYFATSIGSENFLYLDDYLQLEGFAYRLVPYRTKNENKFSGSVYTDKLYENLMTKFKWGRMNEPDFMMDSNVERVLSIIDVRDIFNRAADALVKEGDNKRAIEILDRCIALMPNEKVKFDYSMLPLIENYYLAKAPEKANQIVQTMLTRYANDMEYYTSLEGGYYQSADRERQTALAILNNLLQLSKKYNQTELTKKLTDQMGRFVSPEQMKELL